ncbi:MAG TPA: phage major capsid protein [Anaerolineales bacterium]|nr:phage major capsid protein [Anaerolineales bacterium]
MNENEKRLREEAANAYEQGKSLLAQFEGKALPEETSKQIDAFFDECDSKLADARRYEKAGQLDTHLNKPADGARLPAPAGGAKTGELTLQEKAFNKALRKQDLTSDESKALQAGDDTAGGYLLAPMSFAQGLLKFVDDLVYIRQLATVEQITQAESLGYLSLDADLADPEWTVELDTGPDDTVKPFGKRVLTPHPLAKQVKISNTLIRKSTKPIEQIVQQRLGYKLGVTQEKGFLVGDGAQKPLGLFSVDPNGAGIPTTRDVTYTQTDDKTRSDSFIDAKYSLKAQYQMSKSTRWLMHRDLVKTVRKLRDSNNQFMWQPGLGLSNDFGGAPMLLDVPVLMSEYAPNTYTSGLYAALLGDISFYGIVDALSMQLQVVRELYARTNQTGYIIRAESDGMPLLAEAFARLKCA